MHVVSPKVSVLFQDFTKCFSKIKNETSNFLFENDGIVKIAFNVKLVIGTLIIAPERV